MRSSMRGRSHLRSQKQKPAEKEPPKVEKQSVHIVYSNTTNPDTGAQISRQIIGIFSDRKDAEKLEETFNQQDQQADDVVVKAFSSRYALPYVAPIVKDLMVQPDG